MVTQDIQVAIVGTDSKEGVVRAVPLVEHFLNHIVSLAELKPHRPLVRLPAGIALYAEDHRFGLAAVPGTATILMMRSIRLVRRIACFDCSIIDLGERASLRNSIPTKVPTICELD